MRYSIFTIISALFLLLNSSIAVAGDSARASFDKGKELFADGDYEEAAEQFRAAYTAKPTWKLLFNIAQAETAAKRYGLALEAFETYLAEGGDEIPEERNNEVLDEIQRLRFLVGVLEVDAPDKTEIWVDDVSRGTIPTAKRKRVAVGTHQVVLKLDGKILVNRSVSISGGMTATVSVAKDASNASESVMPPQPASEGQLQTDEDGRIVVINESGEGQAQKPAKAKKAYKPLLVSAIVSGVLGLGATGMGIGFTVKGANDAESRDANAVLWNSTFEPTYKTAAQNDQTNLEFDGTMMIVGYSVGGALLVTGVVLLAVRSKKQKRESAFFKPTFSGMSVQF